MIRKKKIAFRTTVVGCSKCGIISKFTMHNFSFGDYLTTVKGMLKAVIRRSPRERLAMNRFVMVWSLLVLTKTAPIRYLLKSDQIIRFIFWATEDGREDRPVHDALDKTFGSIDWTVDDEDWP
jgi:hypothetical protein